MAGPKLPGKEFGEKDGEKCIEDCDEEEKAQDFWEQFQVSSNNEVEPLKLMGKNLHQNQHSQSLQLAKLVYWFHLT